MKQINEPNFTPYDWFDNESDAWAAVFQLWENGAIAKTPIKHSESTWVVLTAHQNGNLVEAL